MSPTHEDLVAYALGGLEAEEMARIEARLDDEARARLEEIENHLGLHDQVPEIRPAPELWQRIEARVLTEEALPQRRTFFQRFWMPMAAAALLLIALVVANRPPTGVPVTRLHGSVTRTPGGELTAQSVSRVRIGDGVVATMDAGTIIVPLSEQRLALKAGRVFLEVAKSRRGFAVEAGELEAITVGTAFLVERLPAIGVRVWTESGTVLCRWPGGSRSVEAGERFVPSAPELYVFDGESPRDWFTRPTIEARVLAPTTLQVVIRNEMPDSITLAPPTGGEPFLFASFAGRDYPLPLAALGAPLALAPGADRTYELRLPVPAPDEEAVFVSCPSLNLRVEATR